MDFGTLLHVAQKNSGNEKPTQGKYYSTKFSAPKKESRDKKLSDNIRKFLAKKEAEDREKAIQDKRKVQQLLSMRDQKAKNKIKKMLKVTKSANKSVLADAIDINNTAVTLQGPEQPDEDDYGYVSQEAAAFYQKYMEKVKAIPNENKFAPSRPSSKNDLLGTKDRVKAAIQREKDDVGKPIKPVQSPVSQISLNSDISKAISNSRKNLYDPLAEKEAEEKKRIEEQKKAKIKKKTGPPPLDFQQLLKLAEKKQHEPLEIVVEVKKEPERLLTKKEKEELEEREQREKRRKELKLNEKRAQNAKLKSNESTTIVGSKQVANVRMDPPSKNVTKCFLKSKPDGKKISSSQVVSNTEKNQFLSKEKKLIKTEDTTVNKVNSSKTQFSGKPNINGVNKNQNKLLQNLSKRDYNSKTNLNKNISKESCKSAKQQTNANSQKARDYSPSYNKNMKKQNKRRIIDDDDDEDEYDSELDDFIDDGPEDDNNYSNYIKEIFGYDKSKYRDQNFDDAAMESSFSQQMKEEYISKKIGIMEDLEDIRMENEEKRLKLQKRKKLKT